MQKETHHLFGIEIVRAIARDMLCEPVCLETLTNRLEYDLLECSGGVLAELARMGMMTVWHVQSLDLGNEVKGVKVASDSTL